MQFDPSDIDTILASTGEPVEVQFGGVTVKTIQAKFRKNFQSVSPYESNVGILLPAFTCKSSDLVGVDNNHTFLIQTKEYKLDGKPEEQPSGFTLVKLGLKK
jgi:hypothetical protein